MTSDEARSVLAMKEKDLLSMAILKESDLVALRKRISELEVYDQQLQDDKRKSEIAGVAQTKTEMTLKLRSLGLDKEATILESIKL